MSDKINDGGPAFPGFTDTPGYGCCKRVGGEGDFLWENHTTGLSKRDYFAAAALNGITASNCGIFGTCFYKTKTCPDFAVLAYQLADAMITESEKTK